MTSVGPPSSALRPPPALSNPETALEPGSVPPVITTANDTAALVDQLVAASKEPSRKHIIVLTCSNFMLASPLIREPIYFSRDVMITGEPWQKAPFLYYFNEGIFSLFDYAPDTKLTIEHVMIKYIAAPTGTGDASVLVRPENSTARHWLHLHGVGSMVPRSYLDLLVNLTRTHEGDFAMKLYKDSDGVSVFQNAVVQYDGSLRVEYMEDPVAGITANDVTYVLDVPETLARAEAELAAARAGMPQLPSSGRSLPPPPPTPGMQPPPARRGGRGSVPTRVVAPVLAACVAASLLLLLLLASLLYLRRHRRRETSSSSSSDPAALSLGSGKAGDGKNANVSPKKYAGGAAAAAVSGRDVILDIRPAGSVEGDDSVRRPRQVGAAPVSPLSQVAAAATASGGAAALAHSGLLGSGQQVVEAELARAIRSSHSRSRLMTCAAESHGVELGEKLGSGSFGQVFKATWQATTVAVKVTRLPSSSQGAQRREQMAIMETAISASIRHPNTVQLYTYLLQPAPIRGDAAEPGTAVAGRWPFLRGSLLGPIFGGGSGNSAAVAAQQQQAQASGAGTNSAPRQGCDWEVWLLLEYCDRGSLREALKNGLFAEPAVAATATAAVAVQPQDALQPPTTDGAGAPSSPPSSHGGSSSYSGGALSGAASASAASSLSPPAASSRYRFILDTALDIAKAMVHLHHENVVHADLKARNVLLQSCPSEERGFTAKVADFGLSLRVDAKGTYTSTAVQGA